MARTFHAATPVSRRTRRRQQKQKARRRQIEALESDILANSEQHKEVSREDESTGFAFVAGTSATAVYDDSPLDYDLAKGRSSPPSSRRKC